MSMQDFEEACALMEAQPHLLRMQHAASEATIAHGAAILGVRFPATYRRFLARYGSGNFGDFYVRGLVGDADVDTVQYYLNVVWNTRFNRTNVLWTPDGGPQVPFPAHYIEVAMTADNIPVCLDTSQFDARDECPIVEVDALRVPRVSVVAPDFGAFLLAEVQEFYALFPDELAP